MVNANYCEVLECNSQILEFKKFDIFHFTFLKFMYVVM